jgi:hypothetical protein
MSYETENANEAIDESVLCALTIDCLVRIDAELEAYADDVGGGLITEGAGRDDELAKIGRARAIVQRLIGDKADDEGDEVTGDRAGLVQ